MRSTISILIAFVSVTFIYSVDTRAVSTNFFKQSSAIGFEQGKKNSVSLTIDGLKLAPELTLVKGIEEQYVWCLANDEYSNVYIGTGDPGTVYKLSPLGNLYLLHRFEELYVQSLAISPSGHVFVGTSPQGIIYRITPWNEAVMVCDLPDSYIWKLRFDKTGGLYAATGPEGRIYRITENGEATVFFDSPQSHILDIVFDKADNLYACSEPDGLVYKLNSAGDPFMIYDADEGEVHGLAIDSAGNIYAGTASGARPPLPIPQEPTTRPPLEPLPSVETVPPVEVADTPQQVPHPPPVAPKRPMLRPGYRPHLYPRIPEARNTVYKITPDGLVKRILDDTPGFIFVICTDDKDNVYVGTGEKARLYKIDNDENVHTVLEAEESQVLSLLFLTRRGLFFGTGNEGRLYQLSQTYAEKGTFESSVFDAKVVSTWGNVTWDADVPEGTGLTVATRTGNSEKPDNTWSEWSTARASGEKTQNPPARFVQYRASLFTAQPDASPLLKDVSIAYLPMNQPPEIISLTVDGTQFRAPGEEGQYRPHPGLRAKQTNAHRPPPRIMPRKPPETGKPSRAGIKFVKWQATDPNGDKMSYTLSYKGTRERNWKPLQENTEKFSYLWQTTRVPDGEYLVKLVVSDQPDNPPDVSLITEKTTQPFVIDNTRPQLTRLSASGAGYDKVTAEGTVSDGLSDISRLQCSVDAADWVGIFPDDMIFDAQEESFHFTVEGLEPGEHTIVINATDTEGNIASGKVLIEITGG